MKLSIITPVYNRELTVERTIKSVLRQSYENFELIIVNDGSSDKSDDIVKKHLEDNRIVYVNYTPNKGVNHARNRGIEQVTGDYILFLDSDDYLTDNALEVICNKIKNHNKYNHYLFLIDYRKNDSSIPPKETIVTFEDWLTGKFSGDYMHVLKPECFQNHMFFEDFRAAEYLNWLRIYRDFGDMLLVPEVVLNVDLSSEDSLSRGLTLSSYKAILDKYNFTTKALELYKNDYKRIIPDTFKKLLLENYLLGVSTLKIKENNKVLEELVCIDKKYTLLKMCNNPLIGLMLRGIVIIKGKFKLLFWK